MKKSVKKPTIETVTLNAQVAISKGENQMEYVQVLPENPRAGLVKPFHGAGYGQLLSTGMFEFIRKGNLTSQAVRLLHLQHSTVSKCKDDTLRFTFIIRNHEAKNFSEWLLEEAEKAALFMNGNYPA